MAGTKDKMQRRVYVLPVDLVERIVEIQKSEGIESEVEVVRQLLESAVWLRDTPDTIINRFRSKLISGTHYLDAAKECLVGHPKISSFTLHNEDGIFIEIYGSGTYTIDITGGVWKNDKNGNRVEYMKPVL